MKIGFVVKDLSPSQLSYNIITKLNAELELALHRQQLGVHVQGQVHLVVLTAAY